MLQLMLLCEDMVKVFRLHGAKKGGKEYKLMNVKHHVDNILFSFSKDSEIFQVSASKNEESLKLIFSSTF